MLAINKRQLKHSNNYLACTNEEKTTNGNTPKTNGNNSHNGSEQPKNGEDEDKAKDTIEDQPKNGELENGVVSTKLFQF